MLKFTHIYTMGVRPRVTAKLPVLRPWFWNRILLNLAAASCYFIASLVGGLRCNASRLLRMCWSSRGLPRRFLAPSNAASKKKRKTPIENMGERAFRMDAVCSKAHVMFEASRLHSLSEAGAHKPFFSSLVPLFAVEAVSRPVQWKGCGKDMGFFVHIWRFTLGDFSLVLGF